MAFVGWAEGGGGAEGWEVGEGSRKGGWGGWRVWRQGEGNISKPGDLGSPLDPNFNNGLWHSAFCQSGVDIIAKD